MKQDNFDYIIYTDGSCNNCSPYREGGASCVILNGDKSKVINTWSKPLLGTTNNRAELIAVLFALHNVPEGSRVLICTDSQYCILVLDKTDKKLPPANPDLVKFVRDMMKSHKKVSFTWVKGHSGDEYNEMADKIAQKRTEEVRDKFKIPVYGYIDCHREFTPQEEARINRFKAWLDTKEALIYSDKVPF